QHLLDWFDGQHLPSSKRTPKGHHVKPRTTILAIVCLAASWYYATSLSSMVRVGLKVGVVGDFYPIWTATRAIMRHVNPYGPEVSEQNQIQAYGATAKALGEKDEYRFAYPVYATFPLFPLDLLDFHTANEIALWLFAGLSALSVGWLRGKWDKTSAFDCVLSFSSYPVIIALQVRQPTVLFFALAVGGIALLRADRLVPSGILAALSTGKPQVALPIVLPMLMWTFAAWHDRKKFAISFFTFLLALLSLSSIVTPGWIPEWIAALRAYSQYAGLSIVDSFLGNEIGLAVSGLLFVGLIATLWLHREADLLFQIAFSVVIFQLILHSFIYSEIILLIPAIWVADNATRIATCGWVNQLTLAAVRIAFIEFWLANAVGALLLHTTMLGKSIAWSMGIRGLMVIPVLWSLVAMMIVQLFSAKEKTGCKRLDNGSPMGEWAKQ